MELSGDDIRLIVQLVAQRLGPNAGIDEIKNMVAEIIERFPSTASAPASISTAVNISIPTKKLIVNAFGPENVGLEDKIQSFVNGKSLRMVDVSSTSVDDFRSVVAIVDYSGLMGDINQLKFELSKVCETLGFKAMIQDSSYYGA
jgi:predicted amino acid-binding ACT domain protein